MKGKVFANSANLYQDQAKVLFDYYKRAAEKIVTEEEKYEKEIAICKETIAQFGQEFSKAKLISNLCFGTGALLVLIGALIFVHIISTQQMMGFMLLGAGLAVAGYGVVSLMKGNSLQAQISDNEGKIQQFEAAHKEIFRDYKVTKMGIGYVPIAAQIPFEDKSFVIDYTGIVNNQEFKLSTLRQADLFTNSITTLDSLLKEVPIVEQSTETESVDTDTYSLSIQNVTYHDYFGKLDRALRTSAYCMEDLEVTSVSLPVIIPDSDYAKFIIDHSTNETGAAPIFETFNATQFQDEIDRFHSLNEMKKSLEKHQEQFEEVLKSLMLRMANSVQAITQVKLSATNTLVDMSNKVLFKILKTSFNHYSPNLEAEEIARIRTEKFNYQDSVENYQPFQLKPSSKVKYDLVSDTWVAEDGTKTNFPFGVHQIHEEIVAPIVQNLMQETRLERLQIYNNIKDQKINYLNQWHRDTEDFYGRNRAESSDLINIMRSTLTEYVSSYNAMVALKKTEDGMENTTSLDATVVKSEDNAAEFFAAFEAKSKDFQKIQTEFSDYMDRLKQDIDIRAEKFEYIEYYDASLRDGNFKDYAVATGRVHELDARRKPLIAVNPFFAETSELPPLPSIDNITYEHMSINLPKIAQKALDELNGSVTTENIQDDDVTRNGPGSGNNNDADETMGNNRLN